MYPTALMSLMLPGDREVRLTSLYQMATYAGVITGWPGERHNNCILQNLIRRAIQLYPSDSAPLVLPFHYQPFTPPGRPPTRRLPWVTCIGHFTSSKPTAKHPDADGSRLIVLWLQDQMQPQFSPENRSELLRMAWEERAEGTWL